VRFFTRTPRHHRHDLGAEHTPDHLTELALPQPLVLHCNCDNTQSGLALVQVVNILAALMAILMSLQLAHP
jgi:hypothetical protein